MEGTRVPVAGPADLIALKLYAGGPQDAWDIAQLLGATDGAAIATGVERLLPDMPGAARALWTRIRGAAEDRLTSPTIVAAAVFGTNLLGDALRDTLDPRLRGS